MPPTEVPETSATRAAAGIAAAENEPLYRGKFRVYPVPGTIHADAGTLSLIQYLKEENDAHR